MRIRVDNSWIAGHPDYAEAVWTGAQNAVWLPTRGGDWQAGAGFERLPYEDTHNPAFSLRFDLTRTFERQREAADWITSMHSRVPPHAWAGRVRVRFDLDGGGTTEVDCGECVIQLVGPIQSLGGTGRLALVAGYLITGGVLGDQPVITDPVNPPVVEYPVEYYAGGYPT